MTYMEVEAIQPFNIHSNCTRFDWRDTPFSPGLRCIQALSLSGGTASGAGFRRSDALVSCQGELAEITALEANHTLPCLSHLNDNSWTGIAAAQSLQEAKRRALFEALERAATDLWWQGLNPAIEMDLDQEDNHLLSKDVIQLRGELSTARSTKILALNKFSYLSISVAVSEFADGSGVIFGFGAHTSKHLSARSALLEMALMELNLLETSQDRHLRKLTHQYRDRHRNLIQESNVEYQSSGRYSDDTPLSVESKLASTGIRVEYFDITVSQKNPVVIARLMYTESLGKGSPHAQRPLI